MASSDAGTSSRTEYQVFVSFRGPDTRIGFTNVLYHSLHDAGIRVFLDDEELRVGEMIAGSLKQAIDNSRIYIPVFSKTYASSKWCLCELRQIMANTLRSGGNKKILPIFYDVEPDDVKLKSSLYRDAILQVESEKKLSNEQVDACREALLEVGAIKGWEVKKYKGHGDLIKLVVEKVVKALKTKHRKVTEHLVGIHEQVGAVSKLLDINSDDVRIIKIHGMGGIGKTTLAKVVFNKLSSHFGKYCCFLEDVRMKTSLDDDLVKLQKKLASDISHPVGTRSIDDSDDGMKRIEEVFCNKKVFIVLDDIDDIKQVEKLIGENTLYSGSRVVITTRDKDVLRTHRQKYRILDYEMEVMSIDCALELFSWHAFNNDSPLDDYNDLSREIAHAIGRLPLALEVIGSLLYNKKQQIWQETLEKLTKAPHEDVFGKLKISYDTLTSEQQQIFLDIACFFIGEDKTNPIYMWKDCEFFAETGVDALINLSLVKIMDNNNFWMHDQLRDMGREIVCQENPTNPEKRSRLWIGEEIFDAITTKEMKRNVQALDLDLRKSYMKHVIESEEIGRFEHLRYLKLTWGTFAGNLANYLTKLRWIVWNDPPPTSQPANMHFKNVVVLEFSEIDFIDDLKLNSLIKMARKLKVLSIASCGRVIRTPDFSGCPYLERLTFINCFNLRKIDSSIGKLKCLIYLSINGCSGLEDLPEEIGNLVNLQHFSVQNCKVKKIPDSIWKLKSLRVLHFVSSYDGLDSANSWELPTAIRMLQNLEELHVCSHSLKGQIPHAIGSLPFLRILEFSWSQLSEVPKSISILTCLQRLELIKCDKIQELPMLPASLTSLYVCSTSLRVVPDLSNLTNLVELDLNSWGEGDKLCIGELRWIGRLSKLTTLRLGLHNVHVPAELASLPLLNQLDLFGLDLQTFPQLPSSLQELRVDNFNSIVSLSRNLINLSYLGLCRSPMQEFELDGHQLPSIRNLFIEECESLERFGLLSMRKLVDVNVVSCPKLVELRFSWLESLATLCIQLCESFEGLVDVGEVGHDNNESVNKLISGEGTLILPLRAFNKLRSFILSGSHKILEMQIVGTSESWEYFALWYCPYVQNLGGLSNLKNLKRLLIFGNERLQVIKGLDELEFLDELKVRNCGLLESLIDLSNTKLPNNCRIDISGCKKSFRGFLESYKHQKEQELKRRRMLGRVSLLLKIGIVTGLSAVFLPKALAMNKKRIGASGRNRN